MPEQSAIALNPTASRADYSLIPRVIVAVVLLVAAGLKVHQLSTEPLGGSGLLANRWVNLLEADFEVVLGLWLASGYRKRLAWLVTLACFIFFCGVTGYKFLKGYASCGCFGAVKVPPLVTLMMDSTIVLMLALLRPKPEQQPTGPRWRRLTITLFVAVAAIVASAVPVISYTPARVTSAGKIEGDEGTVLLNPEGDDWKGHRLPIADYIDIWGELGKGEWTVVLVRHGCSGCKVLVPAMAAKAMAAGPGKASRIALIQVPLASGTPYGDPATEWPSLGIPLLTGKLDNSRKWECWTPVVLRLKDGTVRDVLVAQSEETRKKAIDMIFP